MQHVLALSNQQNFNKYISKNSIALTIYPTMQLLDAKDYNQLLHKSLQQRGIRVRVNPIT